MATLGVQRQSTMAIFTLRAVSVMMQKRVISGSRARCGVDRYIWGEWFCGFVNAFVIVDFSAIAGQEAHTLAAVVGTAPAKG